MLKTRTVIMVMYDMPMVEAVDKRNYMIFRKSLKKNGYVQLQKSIYVKLLLARTRLTTEVIAVQTVAPKKGTVNILTMTLAEFKDIISVGKNKFDMNMFSDEVVII